MVRRSSDEEININITPLIDIVFLLLLFFVLTSTFDIKEERSLDINLPEASSGAEIKTDSFFKIFINEKNEIYVGSKVVSIEELQTETQKAIKNGISERTGILADRKTEHGTVVKVMDLLRKNGIYNINIEVQEP